MATTSFLAQLGAVIKGLLAAKVDKVTGYGLSKNDFDDAQKTKLGDIEAGAQVNTVNSVAGKAGVVTLTDMNVFSKEEVLAKISELQALLDGGAPETINAFKEFAAAINNDPNYETTMVSRLSKKVNIEDLGTIAEFNAALTA